jgi:hypothetical protein
MASSAARAASGCCGASGQTEKSLFVWDVLALAEGIALVVFLVAVVISVHAALKEDPRDNG